MTDRHDPTDDSAFTSAIDGATLPGMVASWEYPGFVCWTFDGCETGFYATPEWEGASGIAVNIMREGANYTKTIPVEWTGDAVENARLYLAAMRRWRQALPTLYARWDCDPDTDFAGTVLDLCAQYDQSNLWEPLDWDYDKFMSLLDILDNWSKCPDGVDLATRGDNMVIRNTKFLACEGCEA